MISFGLTILTHSTLNLSSVKGTSSKSLEILNSIFSFSKDPKTPSFGLTEYFFACLDFILKATGPSVLLINVMIQVIVFGNGAKI